MTTDPTTNELSVLALIEAFEARDTAAAVTMLATSTRDELIALSAVLANYVVSVAASHGLDLAAWIPEQRQRLLEAHSGDDPPGVS